MYMGCRVAGTGRVGRQAPRPCGPPQKETLDLQRSAPQRNAPDRGRRRARTDDVLDRVFRRDARRWGREASLGAGRAVEGSTDGLLASVHRRIGGTVDAGGRSRCTLIRLLGIRPPAARPIARFRGGWPRATVAVPGQHGRPPLAARSHAHDDDARSRTHARARSCFTGGARRAPFWALVVGLGGGRDTDSPAAKSSFAERRLRASDTATSRLVDPLPAASPGLALASSTASRVASQVSPAPGSRVQMDDALVVPAGALIRGYLRCRSLLLAGDLVGNVHCTGGPVVIRTGANLQGRLVATGDVYVSDGGRPGGVAVITTRASSRWPRRARGRRRAQRAAGAARGRGAAGRGQGLRGLTQPTRISRRVPAAPPAGAAR